MTRFGSTSTSRPIRDADGNILYTLGVIENIEDRRRMTETLLESDTRLRLLNQRLAQLAEERSAELASSRAQLQAFFVNSVRLADPDSASRRTEAASSPISIRPARQPTDCHVTK